MVPLGFGNIDIKPIDRSANLEGRFWALAVAGTAVAQGWGIHGSFDYKLVTAPPVRRPPTIPIDHHRYSPGVAGIPITNEEFAYSS